MKARVFFGWLLMAVGGLVAVLCGGCTLFCIIVGAGQGGGGLGAAALVVGGIPCLVGIGLFKLGQSLGKPD